MLLITRKHHYLDQSSAIPTSGKPAKRLQSAPELRLAEFSFSRFADVSGLTQDCGAQLRTLVFDYNVTPPAEISTPEKIKTDDAAIPEGAGKHRIYNESLIWRA